jgi:hypothetical protein
MSDSRIFTCTTCGKDLDLREFAIKGYVPDPGRWRHYDTKLEKNCADPEWEKLRT